LIGKTALARDVLPGGVMVDGKFAEKLLIVSATALISRIGMIAAAAAQEGKTRMLALIAGVLLWWAAHLFKRLAPDARAGMGDRGKGLVALALGVSVILMIVGYRRADVIALYAPLAGMGHLNNLAMLVAVFLFGVGGTKGTLYTRMRHPMLWGTVIWAGSHLLVNGDLASVILFGGIGAWALVAMAAINRAEPWEPPDAGRGIRGDEMNLVGTLVVYGLIAGIHSWLGYNPFLGTYG